MSIRLMAEVFETDLPAGEKLVLLAMADHADDSGDNCFPSIPRIAKKASMTRRGVQRILRRLQESNLIRPKGLRPGGTIEYIITINRGATVVRGGDPRSRGEGRPVVAGGATSVRGGSDPRSPESSVEPSLKHQEEKTPPAPKTGALLSLAEPILPDWIPRDAWDAFLEMRKGKRAKVTPKAAGLLFKKLDELRQAGQDVRAVVEQSVMRSWTGFFPVKGDHNNGHSKGKQQFDLAATHRAIFGTSLPS